MTPADLRAVRQARGETQTELAAALGVDMRTIQRWEAGKSPIPVAVERLLAIWPPVAAGKEKRKWTSKP